MVGIYDKVFGEKHGKDLWKLTPEEQRLLHKARTPERERRSKRTKKIVNNNLHYSKNI